MKKPAVYLIALTLLSLSGYVIGVYLLSQVVRHFPSIGPFVFVESHGLATFSIAAAVRQPAAFMAVMAVCLCFDAALLGLDRSALKRLLDASSASTRVDLFYTVMRIVGGFDVLVFVFSFGTLIWLVNQIHRVLHVGVLQHVHSFVLQFLAVMLINTFISYWAHRLMHTRWLWELHKVHHAAEEMNVVTAFRNHPIEQLIMTLLNAFPVALLGAAPPVILAYAAFSMLYGSLAHSEIKHRSRLWDIIWITPAAHRIHHSNRAEHFDTNFGVITFWDYLFGTYHTPINEPLSYGVDDGETFNRPHHLQEVFANVRRWMSTVVPGRRLQLDVAPPATSDDSFLMTDRLNEPNPAPRSRTSTAA